MSHSTHNINVHMSCIFMTNTQRCTCMHMLHSHGFGNIQKFKKQIESKNNYLYQAVGTHTANYKILCKMIDKIPHVPLKTNEHLIRLSVKYHANDDGEFCNLLNPFRMFCNQIFNHHT